MDKREQSPVPKAPAKPPKSKPFPTSWGKAGDEWAEALALDIEREMRAAGRLR